MSAPLAVGFDGRYLDADFPGIGRYSYELLSALAEHDLRLRVVVSQPEPTRFDLRPLADAGVELVPCTVSRRTLAEQMLLPRLVGRLGVDLWHTPYFVTAYRMPLPLVVTVHDAIGALDRSFLPSWRARLAYRWFSASAIRAARVVVTSSAAARTEIIEHLAAPPQRVEVVPCGVSAQFSPASPAAVASVCSRLRLRGPFVLHVGTDKPHKNLGRLLHAWNRLQPRLADDTTLVLAGYRNGEARPAPAGVRIVGAVDDGDLPALYSAATLVVVPSLAEGFGLPVLEAMACGAPVACARAGSLPEVAGPAADYFDPIDVDGMASVIGALLDAPEHRKALAVAGRQRAAQWSWRATAQSMVDLYRRVAQRT